MIVLDLIKSIDVKEEYSSENEEKRKWFRFGAYDALRNLSEKVKEYDEPKSKKINVK